ncbi:MAG: hypothetical protein U5P41_00375 [Gammaproteobacteria bacterium]|nr:hypothetical protein [Gammaproteobacteria bacterium]
MGIAIAFFSFSGRDTTPAEIAADPPPRVDASALGEKAATAASAAKVESLLNAARDDMKAMRLTTPADNNAHGKFRQVLSIEPGNVEAQRGLEAIYRRYLQLAQGAIQDNEFDRAGTMLDRAATVMPDGPGLMRARVSLEQRRTEVRMQSLSDTMQESGGGNSEPTDAGSENSGSSGNEAVRRLLGR